LVAQQIEKDLLDPPVIADYRAYGLVDFDRDVQAFFFRQRPHGLYRLQNSCLIKGAEATQPSCFDL
jgi:hypothetical protein